MAGNDNDSIQDYLLPGGSAPIGGYDPRYIAYSLRGLPEEQLSSLLESEYVDQELGDPRFNKGFFARPDKLRVAPPQRSGYAMGVRSRREAFNRDTAAFEDELGKFKKLVAAEQARRAIAKNLPETLT